MNLKLDRNKLKRTFLHGKKFQLQCVTLPQLSCSTLRWHPLLPHSQAAASATTSMSPLPCRWLYGKGVLKRRYLICTYILGMYIHNASLLCLGLVPLRMCLAGNQGTPGNTYAAFMCDVGTTQQQQTPAAVLTKPKD